MALHTISGITLPIVGLDIGHGTRLLETISEIDDFLIVAGLIGGFDILVGLGGVFHFVKPVATRKEREGCEDDD